ncbi:MAG: protease modulator HflC [Pseudomonadota bacterium]
MRIGLIGILIAGVIAVVVALNSFFIVNPTQQALVLQFGEVRQAIREPGLNTKIPVVQDVLFLDKRVLDLNVPAQEIIASDQKRLVVDAFMRYRIANPVRFFQTVNNVREGATRLSTFAQSSLRAVLADASFTDIVRDDRPELMDRITADVSARARDIGVEVVDVKIRRADLPEANSEAIFARMQTERIQEATQIRAQGQEAAQRLRAAADRTATVVRAEAQREAEQIRGQGDGQANAIFARAYSQDANFFTFYRAMQAYEGALAADDTRLVLSPDAEFFRYFNDPSGIMRASVSPDAQTPAAPLAPEPEAPAGAEISAVEEGVTTPVDADTPPAVAATFIEEAEAAGAERAAEAEANDAQVEEATEGTVTIVRPEDATQSRSLHNTSGARPDRPGAAFSCPHYDPKCAILPTISSASRFPRGRRDIARPGRLLQPLGELTAARVLRLQQALLSSHLREGAEWPEARHDRMVRSLTGQIALCFRALFKTEAP